MALICEGYKYDFYLAGPFFNDQQKRTMDTAKSFLETSGFAVCDPRDLSPVLVDMAPEMRARHTSEIYTRNVDAMEESFGIIACIDDRDTGTAFELGFMVHQRRAREDHDDWTGPIITFSGFGHGSNVMLSEATDMHFQTIADMQFGFSKCMDAFRAAQRDPSVSVLGWAAWLRYIIGVSAKAEATE
jgi:hypothetical protein